MSNELTFESAHEQINAYVEKLEKGNLTLEESMECYEKAFKLMEFCYKQLDDCKLRITEINERFEKLKKTGDVFDD